VEGLKTLYLGMVLEGELDGELLTITLTRDFKTAGHVFVEKGGIMPLHGLLWGFKLQQ